MSVAGEAEHRFRAIFRRLHAGHAACQGDEWLMEPCRDPDGRLTDRPVVWSRRNGPWRPIDVLWIGAAPGNTGGRGTSDMGAHGTRIPFGGDIAGANLDVLLGSIGLDRNRTFIVAALNQLPAVGGGEPALEEVRQPVGAYASSIHALRDTVLAARPRLIVLLGNVAVRALFAAVHLAADPVRLPTLARLTRTGLERGRPARLESVLVPDAEFERAWKAVWTGGITPLPGVLWLTHPSAQNMSPFARSDTLFHTRMLEARAALRATARRWLDTELPVQRPKLPDTGIYALPEWRERIAPFHARLDALWREHGI